MIYLEALNAPNATSYTNIDAELYGVSLDGTWTATDHFTFQAGLAWQRGEKTDRPANATKDVLGEIPPLKGRLAASWANEDWRFGATLLFQDSYDRIDPDILENRISGWSVLNLVASHQFDEHIGISVGIDNVFDKRYAVANAFVRDPFRNGVVVNEPGRFFYIRVATTF